MSQEQTRIRTRTSRPVVVADETEAAEAAFDGLRRRPVLARDGGRLLVCSSRTARRHGWQVVGRLFAR